MLVVVGPVIVLTLAAAWWYRASNRRARRRPDWSYSGQVELVVWAVPAMVVILLAGVGWIGAHDLDPARKLASKAAPLDIEIVSLDWKWLFIYRGERIATVDRLVVPVGTPLDLSLTSATVMNAFFVPQLGSQIYTMPGMITHLNLMADREGDYPGLSANFSGNGFSDMRFIVHAVPEAEFRRWLARVRTQGDALDDAAWARLGTDPADRPPSFRSVAPDFFEHIVQDTVHRGSAPAKPI